MTTEMTITVTGRRRTNAWLESELAEARTDLEVAGRRIDEMSLALTRKNDMLILALDQRDRAYDDRDRANHSAREDYAEHMANEARLRSEVESLRKANGELSKINQNNFDKAARMGDIAAVLACMAAEDHPPAETVIRMSKIAAKMIIKLDDTEEVRVALKRGYAAQVDEVVNIADGIMKPEDSMDDDAFQDAVERYGAPYDFSGYNSY